MLPTKIQTGQEILNNFAIFWFPSQLKILIRFFKLFSDKLKSLSEEKFLVQIYSLRGGANIEICS